MIRITRKGWEKKLDEIVKSIVLARDKWCVTCPLWKKIKPDFKSSPVMQPGHLFTRGARSVRWDLRNVYVQCQTCNHLHEYHPDVLTTHAISVLGKRGYGELMRQRHQIKKFTIAEMEVLYGRLQAKSLADEELSF